LQISKILCEIVYDNIVSLLQLKVLRCIAILYRGIPNNIISGKSFRFLITAIRFKKIIFFPKGIKEI